MNPWTRAAPVRHAPRRRSGNKVLDTLSHLAAHPAPCTVVEIATATGLDRSSVQKHLAELRRRNLVEPVPRDQRAGRAGLWALSASLRIPPV